MTAVYPHRIRLRGPWEQADGSRGRITMPCRGGDLGNDTGPVRLARRFGLPRKLDPHERVWLTLHGVHDLAGLWLNHHSLACEHGTAEFEITALLETRNELRLEMARPPGEILLWEEIALEIRCTAYLQDIHLAVEPSAEGPVLHACGSVVGSAEQPLEVYVLHQNRTVAYQPVEAGQRFAAGSEPLGEPLGAVRIELVCGAVVWYTWETSLAGSDAPPRGS